MNPGKVNSKEARSSRYSVFKISDMFFALEIFNIKEVRNFSTLTKIPNSEPYLSGVFNLRGKIITVLDIRYLLHLDVQKNNNAKMAVLAEHDKYLVGIQVDQVMDFINIEEIKIQLPSGKVPAEIAKYIMGIFETDESEHIYLLDIIKIIRIMKP